jgi:hypothetical protein
VLPCRVGSYGLYYKNIAVINDTSRVVRMMIVSVALSCGVTYNCHSDDSRGVIYSPRVINHAPRVIHYAPRGVINYAHREHL